MSRTSKKHTKLLILTLTIIVSLSVGANLVMNYTMLGNTGSMRSGMFVGTIQSVSLDGWYFYAEEANGNSTFFANLNQANLESLSLKSQIACGEMSLVISQNETRFTFDLSTSEAEITPGEIDVSMMEPGRVEMRLYFINVKDVRVVTNWSDIR